jgi:predicted ATPase
MDLKNFNGFKLVSLEIHKHKILGTNTFNFIQAEDNNDSIYSTILIGPNGTGKSEVLKLIVNIFRNLSLLKNGQKEKNLNCYFKLKYLNTHEYTLSNYLELEDNIVTPLNFKSQYVLKQYDKLIDINKKYNDGTDNVIPNITASSFMLSDKFFIPITDNDKLYFKNYNYLGLKSNRQSGSTQKLFRRTVDYIVENTNTDIFKKSVSKIANFLELDTDGIEISYKTKYTNRFWNGDLSPSNLEDFFFKIEVQYEEMQGKEPPFKLRYYRSLKSKSFEQIENLCDYINKIARTDRLIDSHSNRSKFKTLAFNVASYVEHDLLSEEKNNLDIAISLGLLDTPQINFISSSKIPLTEASSGEINLFATMIGLVATIKYGSLIIIDEPEVSLHPNWQMKYLHFLTELLSDYNDSHILIATHSHFLISDLQGDSGKIIGLKKSNKKIEITDINTNTFGWSAEEILYEIFNVKSTRNSFIEYELTELVDILNRDSTDKLNELSKILIKLSNLELNPNDPLKVLIEKGYDYLKFNNYA